MRTTVATVVAAAWVAGSLAARADDPAVLPLAPGVTRVPFTAVEAEARGESIGRRLTLLLAGGGGLPEMDALNGYANWINTHFDGSVDEVEAYWSCGVGLEYRFAERWYAGLVWRRLEAGADGTVWFGGQPSGLDLDLTAQGAEAQVRWVIAERPERWSCHALAAVGGYTSSYVETENGYRASGDDEAAAFRLGVGATLDLTSHLGVRVDAGYLWLTFDSYEGDGRTVRFVSPGQARVEADFSGPAISAGLTWRF